MGKYPLRCLSSSVLCDVRFYLSTWNIESAFGLHAFYNMSGFICMSNRAPHDYTWNVCGFFIICIRWLLFLFLFLPFKLYTLYHLYFCRKGSVLRLSKSSGCLENGCRGMFYCCFQQSVVLRWMSAWMKITLQEECMGSFSSEVLWSLKCLDCVRKTICHDKFRDFINSLFWSPNILFPKKTFWTHRSHVQRALMVMSSNSLISPRYHGE